MLEIKIDDFEIVYRSNEIFCEIGLSIKISSGKSQMRKYQKLFIGNNEKIIDDEENIIISDNKDSAELSCDKCDMDITLDKRFVEILRKIARYYSKLLYSGKYANEIEKELTRKYITDAKR